MIQDDISPWIVESSHDIEPRKEQPRKPLNQREAVKNSVNIVSNSTEAKPIIIKPRNPPREIKSVITKCRMLHQESEPSIFTRLQTQNPSTKRLKGMREELKKILPPLQESSQSTIFCKRVATSFDKTKRLGITTTARCNLREGNSIKQTIDKLMTIDIKNTFARLPAPAEKKKLPSIPKSSKGSEIIHQKSEAIHKHQFKSHHPVLFESNIPLVTQKPYFPLLSGRLVLKPKNKPMEIKANTPKLPAIRILMPIRESVKIKHSRKPRFEEVPEMMPANSDKILFQAYINDQRERNKVQQAERKHFPHGVYLQESRKVHQFPYNVIYSSTSEWVVDE